jgi:5-methylcytosine-specific restriction endonuclease McrA
MSIKLPSVGKGKAISLDNSERKVIYKEVYNTRRWQKLRQMVLSRDGFICQICLAKAITTAASVVDHIKPIRQGGAAWDMDNLQSLCSKYHKDKTNKESLNA